MVENLECRRFRNRIDAYLDNELSASEREEMQRHAGTCPECGQLLKEYEDMRAMLADLDRDMDIPPEAAQAWRSSVRDECERRRASSRFGWTKAVVSVAAAVAVLVGATVVFRNGMERPASYKSARNTSYMAGSASYDDYDLEFEAPLAMAATSMDAGGGANATASARKTILESDGPVDPSAVSDSATAMRKPVILRSASRTVQSTEFESAVERLEALVNGSSAWFEYRSVSGSTFADGGLGRTLSATVRVPSEGLDAFLASLTDVGAVTAATDRAEDVSDRYYDTQTRLSTLRAEYERLTDLVTDAADLSDLLLLEDKMYDVQYQIDAIEGELSGLDSRANYSSVSITLDEVREYVEPVVVDPTLGERIAKGFADSIAWVRDFLQDMLVAVVAFSPALVVIIPAVLIIWLVVRSIRRKHRK